MYINKFIRTGWYSPHVPFNSKIIFHFLESCTKAEPILRLTWDFEGGWSAARRRDTANKKRAPCCRSCARAWGAKMKTNGYFSKAFEPEPFSWRFGRIPSPSWKMLAESRLRRLELVNVLQCLALKRWTARAVRRVVKPPSWPHASS